MFVKVRFTFETEEDAMQLWQQLKSQQDWHVSKPRQGTNPKYADNQKWFMYCEYEGAVTKFGSKGQAK